jgi:polysaccharide biosynthesis protein PslH
VFAYSSSTLPYALAVPSRARVMDLVDVDSAKWAAYAEAAWWPKSLLYRMEARGVAALEQQAVKQCDAVFLVSEAETRALGISSPKVSVLGNGVDTEYFKPMDRPASPPSLVFTGTMDYRPNIEGVCWFVRELWPGLKREVADLTFTIVGRNPAPEVLRLADTPGILVTGAVKDVRPHLAAASVAVVPLHIARGIQNKILEAMACGRAVVASSQAIEGLDVKVGPEVLRADATDEWQTCILGLLSDEAQQKNLGAAARARVVADYSWDSQMAPLVSRCNGLAAPGEAAGIPMHGAAGLKLVSNAPELTGRAGEATS